MCLGPSRSEDFRDGRWITQRTCGRDLRGGSRAAWTFSNIYSDCTNIFISVIGIVGIYEAY